MPGALTAKEGKAFEILNPFVDLAFGDEIAELQGNAASGKLPDHTPRGVFFSVPSEQASDGRPARDLGRLRDRTRDLGRLRDCTRGTGLFGYHGLLLLCGW